MTRCGGERAVPWLTASGCSRSSVPVVVLALPAKAREVAKSRGAGVSRGGAGASRSCSRCGSNRAASSTSSSESHSWIPAFGTRYDLGVDGIALVLVLLTAVLVPLLLIAGWNDVPRPTEAPAPACGAHLRRADPDRRGDGDDVVHRPRHPAVLHLLRGHAHPDVLPHRRLRRGAKALARRGEVPALQPVRRADHAGRGHRAVRGDAPGARRRHVRLPAHRRSGVDGSARHRPGRRERAVPRLHVRVRGQGAAVAVPHLAAGRRGRVHAGDGGADDGGRRQGRHVRDASLLPAAVPGAVEDVRAVDHRRSR